MKQNRIRIITLAWCFTFIISGIWAQQNLTLLTTLSNYDILNKQNYADVLFFSHKNVSQDVVGNPHPLFDWRNALLVSKNNKIYSVSARYSPFGDNFQVTYEQQQRTIDASAVKAIAVGERLFISSKYENKKATLSNAFFELLSDGEVKLMQRYVPSTTEINQQQIVINEITTKMYYQRVGYKNAIEIKSLKKELPKIFGEYYELALKIIDDHSFDLSNSNHIKLLFEVLNAAVDTQNLVKSDY
jgi:hypothetical protein